MIITFRSFIILIRKYLKAIISEGNFEDLGSAYFLKTGDFLKFKF